MIAADVHPKARIGCYACGAPRAIDLGRSIPGEYRYLPCAACGEVRIIAASAHDGTRPKKAAREMYERSRYRGARLPSRAS